MNTHSLDQKTAAYRDMAIEVTAFHKELIKNGLTREEALQVVLEYMKNVMRGGKA